MNLWGLTGPRRMFGEQHWKEPLRWNRVAAARGTRARVFCASMADVFEDRDDVDDARARLWETVAATPALDWLLLTKRPENAAGMVPWVSWPSNVWLGATVESDEWAHKRIPALLAVPASIHFLSCEPLLERLHLAPWFDAVLKGRFGSSRVDWVILGGESGAHARPMQPDWARTVRDDCLRYGVLLHFKQWGEWGPENDGTLRRIGKTIAGRELDGRTWDEVPITVS